MQQNNKSLLVVSAIYFLGVVIYALTLGAGATDFLWILPTLLTTAVFMLGVFGGAAVVVYIREILKGGWGKQTSDRVNAIYNSAMTSKRLMEMIPYLAVSTLSFLALSIGKSLIVHTLGYHIDPQIADLDKALHGDVFPHELLAPFIEGLGLVSIINFCYYFWFGVLMLCVWSASFLEQDEVLRARFWWSLQAILIVLGFVMAHALASVGPIYYADFYNGADQPYANYLTHLHHIDATVTKLQSFQVSDFLLSMSRDESVVDLNGISAMPSLHVALAFLFFLYLRHLSKGIGAIAFLFFLAIFIGSVYFAWHYALDGYVGIVGTAFIWWASGKILKPKNLT